MFEVFQYCVFNKVSLSLQLWVLQDTAINVCVKLFLLKGAVTFGWRSNVTFLNLVSKAASCVWGVRSRKNVLSFDTWYKACVSRQTLVSNLMSWTIYPAFCVPTFISKHHVGLVSGVLLIDIWARSLINLNWWLQLHYCSPCSSEVVIFESVSVSNFCVPITWACCLTKKVAFKRNEASVTWDVLTIAHFILDLF